MKAETKSRKTIASELHNLRQNRIYLTMMALLLVGAVIWVLVSLMGTESESEVATKATSLATPINPNLDTAVFATLESKRSFTAEELENFPINRLVKDRTGGYTVVPFDTSKEEIEQLTTGTNPTPTATPTTASPSPTPQTTPLPSSSPVATGSNTQSL